MSDTNPSADFVLALEQPSPRKRIGATTESIALIAARNGEGVILEYDGPGITYDVEAVGVYPLSDHGLDDAPDGLSIWEGRLVSYSDYYTQESDCELVGSFRELTDDEWANFRMTGVPWTFAPTFRELLADV